MSSETVSDERLMSKLEALSTPEPNSGCWLWLGGVNPKGYGVVGYRRKNHRVHRLMYQLSVGEIPPGLVLDHKCRVRSCINPAHLEPVTNKENILRGEGLTSVNARKDVCPQGHKLTPDNIYLAKRRDGVRRRCKICENNWRIIREQKERENV